VTCCPRCSCLELRVHGSRAHVGFARRWGFFGRWVPKVRGVAIDVSCGDCLFAFVIREHGVTEAPLQTAHDQLQRAQAAVNGPAPARKVLEDEAVPPPRNVARPAPDPRVKAR